MAIAYDFDGTLSPGNMQEYEFVPSIGMTSDEFWNEARVLEEQHKADRILAYMRLMLKKAHEKGIQIKKDDFERFGQKISFFNGVEEWFQRINLYGVQIGVELEHYIISSGIKEMILGAPIAKQFKAIFASSFIYNPLGAAEWPALAINYTTKTQYLFRINKGSLEVNDHSKINEYMRKDERAMPFQNMIFIGDGETDIPCFHLMKQHGGYAIAVYKPHTNNAKTLAKNLMTQERVNFIAPADYTENGPIDGLVKAIMQKVVAETSLNQFIHKHQR